MKRYIIIAMFTSFSFVSLQAQELNAKVTLNTQKVQVSNAEIFSSMENDLKRILNDQKWTEATFGTRERIDCTFSIIINEMPVEGLFKAELVVTARRPIYNSSYLSTLFNFRDTQFTFDYLYGQSLDFNSMNITNNLTAVIAYYAYIIIGLDYDSFSPNGGKPYFVKAMDIANSAQSFNTNGWEPFSGKGNRYDVAVALTDDAMSGFHSLWYNYHRQGLDEMAANANRGKLKIIELIPELKAMYVSRPSSPLFTLFAESKLDELVRVCSQTTPDQKKEIQKTLQSIFPTKGDILKTLK